MSAVVAPVDPKDPKDPTDPIVRGAPVDRGGAGSVGLGADRPPRRSAGGTGDPDGVVIAAMKRRHLRAVATIEAASNTHPWSRSLFDGELRMPASRHWLIARKDVRVIGFAGLMWTLDEGHITNFAVDVEHRRRWVATRMLLAQCRDAAARGVCDLTLEVRMSNEGARALYTRFGFAPGGVRKGYYNDNGEDALIMWAHDIGGPVFSERLADIESVMPVQLVREGS